MRSVSSVAQSCLTLCGPMDYSTPGFLSVTNFQSLLKLMSIESVMSSDRLILCFPLLLLPSIFPSISVFSSESALRIRWLKYWSFSISVGNKYSGLISLGWTGLISFQSKGFSRLQFKSISSSVLSLLYGPTLTSVHDYWKNHSFKWSIAKWTFISKMMSLFVNMLSRLVITFLPRSKHLLISWL